MPLHVEVEVQLSLCCPLSSGHACVIAILGPCLGELRFLCFGTIVKVTVGNFSDALHSTDVLAPSLVSSFRCAC